MERLNACRVPSALARRFPARWRVFQAIVGRPRPPQAQNTSDEVFLALVRGAPARRARGYKSGANPI